MKYTVYVLFSKSYKKFYTGNTIDLEKRLREHNSGKTKSIKAFRPWEVIYTEEYNSETEAIKRERYLKSGSGREYLKRLNIR
jgi:putative endonuclease